MLGAGKQREGGMTYRRLDVSPAKSTVNYLDCVEYGESRHDFVS